MSSVSSTLPVTTPLFHSVRDSHARWDILTKLFNEKLAPLYGSQEQALHKIDHGNDRKCRMLMLGETPLGVIVYKTSLSNEHPELPNSLEVKTLLLIDSEKNSGKGYGTLLLNRIMEVARELQAESIHLTVSQNAPQALRFFVKKDFKMIKSFQDKYLPQTEEILFAKTLHCGKKRKFEEVQAAPKLADYEKVTLRDNYIQMIKNGSKTVEGRINSGFFKTWRPGKRVCFHGRSNEVFCTVTKVSVYKTFEEMLTSEGYQKMVPDQKDLASSVRLYKSIPGYSEKEARFGVMAFRLQVDAKP